MIREVNEQDLQGLLHLYTQLHDNPIPDDTIELQSLCHHPKPDSSPVPLCFRRKCNYRCSLQKTWPGNRLSGLCKRTGSKRTVLQINAAHRLQEGKYLAVL